MWSFELPEECRHGSLGGLRNLFETRNPGFIASTRGPRKTDRVELNKGRWKLTVCGPKDNPIVADMAWADALQILRMTI